MIRTHLSRILCDETREELVMDNNIPPTSALRGDEIQPIIYDGMDSKLFLPMMRDSSAGGNLQQLVSGSARSSLGRANRLCTKLDRDIRTTSSTCQGLA